MEKHEIDEGEQPTYYIDGIVFDSWYSLNAYCKEKAPKIKPGDQLFYDLHLKSGAYYETIRYAVVELIDENRWLCAGRNSRGHQSYEFLYRMSKYPNFRII
jgi:hypothetical protein